MLYQTCVVCGGKGEALQPDGCGTGTACPACRPLRVMPVGLTLAQVDRLRELRAAFDRSGLDVSACRDCGEAVICVPDGLALCEPCATKGDES